MFAFLRSLRRKRRARQPFPEEWRPIMDRRLGFVASMPQDERASFLTHLKVFVWEKHWVGAKGLEVTLEMKVVIAGMAARIARGLSVDVYDRLTEIVVYPSHYKHPERDAVIFGEANTWGTVVLSWDAVRNGLAHPSDGRDTTMHEFAHVLDIASGHFNGTPILHRRRDYVLWSEALGMYFRELRANPGEGVVREYGAQNEAEFFAVATEAFFERPKSLRREAPELYRELRRFYQLDPATV